MKKIYHLSTCDTNRKILKSLPSTEGFTLQDIKKEPMAEADVDALKERAGSYEALFSRKATLYKERGLKDKELTEEDFKKLIMEHYTFLSRPVIVMGDKVFVGNSPKTVQAAIDEMNK